MLGTQNSVEKTQPFLHVRRGTLLHLRTKHKTMMCHDCSIDFGDYLLKLNI